MLGTIQKASHVLSLFTESKPEWGVTEISQLLNEPKSTIHELLSSLAQLDWLSRTEKGRYRLGMAFFGYSNTALKVFPCKDECHRALESLAERFGETAQMGILINNELLYADAVHGPHRAGVPVSSIGAYLPAYAFALGKVLLAHEPWEKVQDYVEKKGLVTYTQHTITKLDQLKAELEQVRQQGYAVSRSEYLREWSAVAAPVRGRAGAVVASIGAGVSAPRYPMLSNELIASVISAANSLSKTLGYAPAPVVVPGQ
jgi:IclR family transcriptional regulator, KDG regulon repressor